tara:strand:- start:327 stop:497 length:171 start_codon:yes stop_codon:yes gene_type:complete
MKILPIFCAFLLLGCQKKPINDVEIPEMTFPERLGDYLDDLEDEELDNLPEDTAND